MILPGLNYSPPAPAGLLAGAGDAFVAAHSRNLSGEEIPREKEQGDGCSSVSKKRHKSPSSRPWPR